MYRIKYLCRETKHLKCHGGSKIAIFPKLQDAKGYLAKMKTIRETYWKKFSYVC